MDIPQQWWTLFKSLPLNALIEKSLKANPTIDAAKAALRQARENVYAQKGFYYPTVQGGYSASRTQDSGTISPVLSSGLEPYSLHTAQVSVGFLALFGVSVQIGVIMGGLIADLALSVFLLPTFYVWWARPTDPLPKPEGSRSIDAGDNLGNGQ